MSKGAETGFENRSSELGVAQHAVGKVEHSGLGTEVAGGTAMVGEEHALAARLGGDADELAHAGERLMNMDHIARLQNVEHGPRERGKPFVGWHQRP